VHIFIDESGQFIAKGSGAPKAAASGALVVPASQRVSLLREYKKIRRRLRPGDAEIKGSSLNEEEAQEIVRLCRGFEVLLVAVAVDLSSFSTTDVLAYRDRQADNLVANLSREHQPELVHEIWALSEDLRVVSPQLYLQAFVVMRLIELVLQASTLYFVQRSPRELANFDWVVDAKDKTLTFAERTWSTLLIPLLQNRSRNEPMIMLTGADYSAFHRFSATMPDENGNPTGRVGTDLQKLIGERLTFARSEDQLGLQLVDNLVALVARGLNSKISVEAVAELGRLMPTWKHQALSVIRPTLDRTLGAHSEIRDPHWIRLIKIWTSISRPVLLRQ
jgi:hypothetical protein